MTDNNNVPNQLTAPVLEGQVSCRCCGKGDITRRLRTAIHALMLKVGSLHVTSGYRCPKHNAETEGSSKTSQHMLGNALDIYSDSVSPAEIALAAQEVDEFRNGGIGCYPDRGFVHVDVRCGSARWGWVGDARTGHAVTFLEALRRVP